MSDTRADLLAATRHRDENPKDPGAQAGYDQAFKRYQADPAYFSQTKGTAAPDRPATQPAAPAAKPGSGFGGAVLDRTGLGPLKNF